jgi:3',5'-cyclic AMP phosphodiesterase CpdA
LKLYAVSDLHLANKANRQALEALPPHPDDWLILAGDIGETDLHLQYALSILTRRFKRLLWVPGNHDLWTLPMDRFSLRGEAKYRRLVALCRDYGVLTPEDPYVMWPGNGGRYLLAPLFALYDYSFRPDYVSEDKAVEWAAESGVICTDEELLIPEPYGSIPAWCAQRCRYTEARLEEISPDVSLILINHFPFHRDLVRLRMFKRFSIWCGTRSTENWHLRFPVSILVYGHIHHRSSSFFDGVRSEEVSFGYPRDWNEKRGLEYYLREILPGPPKNGDPVT